MFLSVHRALPAALKTNAGADTGATLAIGNANATDLETKNRFLPAPRYGLYIYAGRYRRR